MPTPVRTGREIRDRFESFAFLSLCHVLRELLRICGDVGMAMTR